MLTAVGPALELPSRPGGLTDANERRSRGNPVSAGFHRPTSSLALEERALGLFV